ncbi:methylmalonyl Co-A mutase-associated GTPase MeaB [Pedobacter frigiditerrae]|uniref:Methylmalonyl Co-A mutase-associated GTPase MeaB n=1 Tax=Pedobacter frigiditerrae TaxID=2530452 RepID=A0A4R0N1A7_9SPHI|nr:methylmalonyl Co-A mutase-associated GTPase MeaB [Pedobacter frigiditerrae]TCC93531.1 methylmalonyl Co-A mutase-associated GTPase MeaB [Pedobacter frigiditerrae]
MNLHQDLKKGIEEGDFRIIARALTLVENDIEPSADLLKSLKIKDTLVLGVTGPPGAGKSTLVNAITNNLLIAGKKVAIVAIDPTSPFNFGSLLGDRIRMSQQFNNPNVYIRSIATRGALGGISPKTLEMVDVLKAAKFDLIIIETVGVGQSEVEIAGLADKTCVVLVPESGDEIQNIKSGLMEIAQVFVVNKADREGADVFANNLKKLVNERHQAIPVFKTVADKNIGLVDLCDWVLEEKGYTNEKRKFLIADKAYKIIQNQKTKGIDKTKLLNDVKEALLKPDFNVYQFTQDWLRHS